MLSSPIEKKTQRSVNPPTHHDFVAVFRYCMNGGRDFVLRDRFGYPQIYLLPTSYDRGWTVKNCALLRYGKPLAASRHRDRSRCGKRGSLAAWVSTGGFLSVGGITKSSKSWMTILIWKPMVLGYPHFRTSPSGPPPHIFSPSLGTCKSSMNALENLNWPAETQKTSSGT